METNQSPAQKEIKRFICSELPFCLAWATLVTLCAIDFYSHPDYGVANIKTRHQFIEALGPWIKYIGNYGYSAIIGAGSGVADYCVRRKNVSKTPLPLGTKVVLASGLNISPFIEGFSKNNEYGGDVASGTIGFLMGFFLAQNTCARIDSHLGWRHNP